MSKKIKKLIKKTRHRIQWPVTEVRSTDNVLRITSDHRQQTHTIYLPDTDVRPIEWLHEYGHATLCETVNPMFSTQYFLRGVGQDIINEITPAAQAASDWFIDQWLFEILPEESVVEIRHHLRMVMQALQTEDTGTPELFTMAALMIAQGQRYCAIKTPTAGNLQNGVNAILQVNPARPSVEALQQVVNGLLACWSHLRVSHVVEDMIDCWQVTGVRH